MKTLIFVFRISCPIVVTVLGADFKTLVQAALEAGQADQLSDHPMTQALINGQRTLPND
jgi:hypothetical protein